MFFCVSHKETDRESVCLPCIIVKHNETKKKRIAVQSAAFHLTLMVHLEIFFFIICAHCVTRILYVIAYFPVINRLI